MEELFEDVRNSTNDLAATKKDNLNDLNENFHKLTIVVEKLGNGLALSYRKNRKKK